MVETKTTYRGYSIRPPHAEAERPASDEIWHNGELIELVPEGQARETIDWYLEGSVR